MTAGVKSIIAVEKVTAVASSILVVVAVARATGGGRWRSQIAKVSTGIDIGDVDGGIGSVGGRGGGSGGVDETVASVCVSSGGKATTPPVDGIDGFGAGDGEGGRGDGDAVDGCAGTGAIDRGGGGCGSSGGVGEAVAPPCGGG